jgi:hypothetical protein
VKKYRITAVIALDAKYFKNMNYREDGSASTVKKEKKSNPSFLLF